MYEILGIVFIFAYCTVIWWCIAAFVRAFKSRRVEHEYERLTDTGREYITFKNLVLESRGGNTPHTEIDMVIVSRYGIFCIEEKSHRGSIYGDEKSHDWAQYLKGEKYPFYNPLFQNYKHIEALRDLLEHNLRAPIHSYVVFPNAYKIKVHGTSCIFNNYSDMQDRIEKHKTLRYSLDEYEIILRTLAYASSKRYDLIDQHIGEVRDFLQNRQ